jgi:hypothetical protein
MEKKIVKKLKLKKEVKNYLIFLFFVTMQLKSVIVSMEKYNNLVTFGVVLAFDVVFYMLTLANKEK